MKNAIFGLCIGVVFVLSACKDKKVVKGTEEYKIAHGIEQGQTNSLIIKDVLFRFPAQYILDPYSSNKIVKGRADRVTFHMDFSHLLNTLRHGNSEYESLVRVEIWQQGYESEQKTEKYLRSINWKSIQVRPDLDLRERIEAGNSGAWGYITYESLNPEFKTPIGGRIVFDCAGLFGKPPEQCRTAYQHPKGPMIWYYLSGQLLPHWKVVHRDVVNLINSSIVG